MFFLSLETGSGMVVTMIDIIKMIAKYFCIISFLLIFSASPQLECSKQQDHVSYSNTKGTTFSPSELMMNENSFFFSELEGFFCKAIQTTHQNYNKQMQQL